MFLQNLNDNSCERYTNYTEEYSECSMNLPKITIGGWT